MVAKVLPQRTGCRRDPQRRCRWRRSGCQQDGLRSVHLHRRLIIADGVKERHRALGEVAPVGDCPFVVDLEQEPHRPSRSTAASFGKMPTTSVRRSISLLTRSSGLVDQILRQWPTGKAVNAVTSSFACSTQASPDDVLMPSLQLGRLIALAATMRYP